MAAVAAFAGVVEAAELVVDNEVGHTMQAQDTEQVLAQAEDVCSSLSGQLRRRRWHQGLRSLSRHEHDAI